MKRTHLILFMCMVLTLVGCQKQDSTPSPTDAATTAAAPIVEQSTAVAHSRLMNVPEHIHTTWTSNTGKTQIKVDADVQFGEVGLLPVFEVCPRLITPLPCCFIAEKIVAKKEAPQMACHCEPVRALVWQSPYLEGKCTE